jgi:hypothetical protein
MRFRVLAALLTALLLAMAGFGEPGASVCAFRAFRTVSAEAQVDDGPIIEPQAIADYLFEHGELPENFITKREAQALGWDRNYLSDVAPGMSIGGDHFGNYEGRLPRKKGRKFYECDVNYKGGKRGPERIIYSNDGHVWYSKDHYETFTELFPSD